MQKKTYFKTFILIGALAIGLAGCNSESADGAQGFTPERLGAIGAEIYVTPEKQADVLAKAGLNEPRFRELIEQLAESTESSRRYQQAFEAELTRLGWQPD